MGYGDGSASIGWLIGLKLYLHVLTAKNSFFLLHGVLSELPIILSSLTFVVNPYALELRCNPRYFIPIWGSSCQIVMYCPGFLTLSTIILTLISVAVVSISLPLATFQLIIWNQLFGQDISPPEKCTSLAQVSKAFTIYGRWVNNVSGVHTEVSCL